ncbi:MAG: hypothetical protein ACKPKO_59600, partial [Candidatus Fonsibacter sp.]
SAENREGVLQRADGSWCRRAKSGKPYPVNAYDERIAEPTDNAVGGSSIGSLKLSPVGHHLWWEALVAAQGAQ